MDGAVVVEETEVDEEPQTGVLHSGEEVAGEERPDCEISKSWDSGDGESSSSPLRNPMCFASCSLTSSVMSQPKSADGENTMTLLKKIAVLNGAFIFGSFSLVDLEASSHNKKLAASAAPWEKPIRPSYGPSSSITVCRKSWTS